MKNQISWIREAGMLLAILLSTGGCLQQVSEPVQQTDSETAPEVLATESLAQIGEDSKAAEDENSDLMADEIWDKTDVSDAAVVAVSDEIVVPPNIHPGPGMIQVIKLANSGVEESVLLAYVTNSGDRFNLGPDEIIYLNDIGIPGRIITSMLQRDHILQAIAAAPPPWDEPMPIAANETSQPETGLTPDMGAGPIPANYVDDSYVQETQPVPPTTAPLFYDALAPYGSWVDVDGYGRCWQPTVIVQQPDWQPYLNCGRWVYTDCGWYWKSDYSWGWAAFHYGRWFRHARLGWCWYPDDVWAPSWVTWRTADDYCGWAPLPPGCGFNVAGDLCWHGRPCAPNFHFGLASECFHFVASHDVCDNHVSHRVIPRAKAPHVFHRTVVSNPTSGGGRVVSNNGASRDRIAAASHREVPRVTLRPTAASNAHATRDRFESNGKVLAVYRPRTGSLLGHAEVASASPSQTASVASRPETRPGTMANLSTSVSHPPIQPPAASTFGSTPTTKPLILRGSDLRGNGQGSGTGPNRSPRDTVATAGSSPASTPNVRGISNLRPGAPAISSGSSLVVIGHRGGSGRDSAQNHGSIKVFSTPPAATATEPQQPRQTDSAANRTAYNHQHQQQQQRTAQDQQQLRNQPNETIPWWLNRSTPSQPQATRNENSQSQVRPEPRQHFDNGSGSRGQNHQSSSQQGASAPAHSQPAQAHSESHNVPPPQAATAAPARSSSATASAPAASSGSSSSRPSAPAQSSPSGGGRR